MKFDGLKTGVKAAVIASSCCTLPLILFYIFTVTGFGSITLALKIPQYKLFFIILGIIFMSASIYLKIRGDCKTKCTLQDVKNKKTLIVISTLTYIFITYLIIEVFLPILSELIF